MHNLRNIAAKLPRRTQVECLRGAKKIYLAKSKKEALKRFKQWKERWKHVVPRAVSCFKKGFREAFKLYGLSYRSLDKDKDDKWDRESF